jgi:hypothetical protein
MALGSGYELTEEPGTGREKTDNQENPAEMRKQKNPV